MLTDSWFFFRLIYMQFSSQDEGEWDEQSQASYFAEGMEGEPETPVNIPPEVDPQVGEILLSQSRS